MSGIYVEQTEIKQKPVLTDRAGNNLWLVKVPKYMADKLRACQTGQQFGMIHTQRSPAGTKLSFEIEPGLCAATDKESSECPSKHEMTLGTLAGLNRSLATYSDTDDTINIEGVIKTRFDVRPPAHQDKYSSRSYLNLKRREAEKLLEPGRKIIFTTKATNNNFRAGNAKRSQLYTTREEKDRKLEAKRTRLDRENVESMILKAFQKNQYISQKSLVHITNQPEAYLKEFLHQMCVYNTKAPHKNTWELKPEYRHYDTKDDQAGTSAEF